MGLSAMSVTKFGGFLPIQVSAYLDHGVELLLRRRTHGTGQPLQVSVVAEVGGRTLRGRLRQAVAPHRDAVARRT